MNRRLVLFAALIISAYTIAVAQDEAVDSAKVVLGADSSAVLVPTSVRQDSLPKTARRQFPTISDSLVNLIFADFDGNHPFPDRPQASSVWQADPALYRLGISMWGDLETLFPLGLTPSHLSRSDNFVGEQSFAGVVPLPYSEEWLRSEPSDRYFLLTPALSGLVLPLGRSTSIYQQSDLVAFDTATSSVEVNRGRGGFANTTFDFASNFGSFGSIRSDGTFQKNDGLFSGADSRLNRMRFIIEPRLGGNIRGKVLYSFNRLRGTRVFFPPTFAFDGGVSDNLATLSSSITYLRSEQSQIDLRLTYKNDDQYFDNAMLRTAQRFRIAESQLEYQHHGDHNVTGLTATARYLFYRSQSIGHSSISYDIGLRRLGELNSKTGYFASASLAGSDYLGPAPNLVASLLFSLNENTTATAIGGWRNIQPQPEMVFMETVQAMFSDSTVDFEILSDADLGAGTARSLEIIVNHHRKNLKLQLTGGIISMKNVAEWAFESDSLVYGGYRAVAADKEVLYGLLKGRAQPLNRVTTEFVYGIREVHSEGKDVTSGPMHTANGSAWYHFPFNRFKLWLNFGAGASFRSAANRYLAGGIENGVLIAETYFSFDLKRFHFYFNYHNLLDTSYTLNNVEQPGRSVWWGFKWKFID